MVYAKEFITSERVNFQLSSNLRSSNISKYLKINQQNTKLKFDNVRYISKECIYGTCMWSEYKKTKYQFKVTSPIAGVYGTSFLKLFTTQI